jgi:ATP phosphoribosyltransferase
MKNKLKIALPKGRLYEEVKKLLQDAGLKIKNNGRNYRPISLDKELEIKILKPQNIPKLVEIGSRDLAFTGLDWIKEEKAEVEVLQDLKLNPVKIVAAIKNNIYENEILNNKCIRIASEYKNISLEYLKTRGIKSKFIRSYGATEVFIPEDADMIIENTETGNTLKENNLKIIDIVMNSSTCIIANKESLKDKWKFEKINSILLLINSVLEARKRLFIEMNVDKDNFENLVKIIPSMKKPTVSKLYGEEGFAIKIAVEKNSLTKLIPILKKYGATDIIIVEPKNIIK